MTAKGYLALLADGDLAAFRIILRDELNVGEMTEYERIRQVFDGFKPHDGEIGVLGADNKMARTFGAALAVVPAARRREFFEVSLQEGRAATSRRELIVGDRKSALCSTRAFAVGAVIAISPRRLSTATTPFPSATPEKMADCIGPPT